MKTQLGLAEIANLSGKKTKKVFKSIKKACSTRWLSNENSVASMIQNYVAVIQTLSKLESDPTCAGLLGHFNNSKFLGTLHVLHSVLPITAHVSRCFQASTVSHSQIDSTLKYAKAELKELTVTQQPFKVG